MTLSVDQVLFKQPIHVGELVTFLASVNHVGRSSMEIGIKVVAEDIRQKLIRHTNSCYLTMVAVDANGKPARVPPLALETRKPFCKASWYRLRRQVSARSDTSTRNGLM